VPDDVFMPWIPMPRLQVHSRNKPAISGIKRNSRQEEIR
jgi:hypothetical protein